LVHRFGLRLTPGQDRRRIGGTFPLDRFGDGLPAKPFGLTLLGAFDGLGIGQR